jgi:hypothetical protein
MKFSKNDSISSSIQSASSFNSSSDEEGDIEKQKDPFKSTMDFPPTVDKEETDLAKSAYQVSVQQLIREGTNV